MKKIWNKICFHLKKECSSEEVFQEKVLKCLEILAYEEETDIDREKCIQVGSKRNIRADFIIKSSHENLFVVEVKQAYCGDNESSFRQLLSYMR